MLLHGCTPPRAAPAPACARAHRWASGGAGVAQPRSAPLPSAASPAPHTVHRLLLGEEGAPPSPAHLAMDPCVPVAGQWGCTPVHASARSRACGDTARSHVCSPGPQRAVRLLGEAWLQAGGAKERQGTGWGERARHCLGLSPPPSICLAWRAGSGARPPCTHLAAGRTPDPRALGASCMAWGIRQRNVCGAEALGSSPFQRWERGEGKVPGLPHRRSRSCGTELSADLLPQLFIGTMGRTCFNDICAGAQQHGSAPSQKEYVSGFTDGKSSVSLTGARSPQSLRRAPPALRRAHPWRP